MKIVLVLHPAYGRGVGSIHTMTQTHTHTHTHTHACTQTHTHTHTVKEVLAGLTLTQEKKN